MAYSQRERVLPALAYFLEEFEKAAKIEPLHLHESSAVVVGLVCYASEAREAPKHDSIEVFARVLEFAVVPDKFPGVEPTGEVAHRMLSHIRWCQVVIG